MCISATMLLVAAAGAQAVGAIVQGQQQQELANARAAESNYQAAQARADADAEREAAQVQADKIRKAGRYQKSEARASLAKSGVAADAGTALTVQDYVTKSAEEDALSTILTGQYRGRKLDLGAMASDREASYQRQAGDNAAMSGFLGAGKSLLSAGYEYKKPASGWKMQG